jgi:hypothetical protein
MSSKRKEYNFDHHAAKAGKFFLVCESHINPDKVDSSPGGNKTALLLKARF